MVNKIPMRIDIAPIMWKNLSCSFKNMMASVDPKTGIRFTKIADLLAPIAETEAFHK